MNAVRTNEARYLNNDIVMECKHDANRQRDFKTCGKTRGHVLEGVVELKFSLEPVTQSLE